ncbi:hypothetical protein EDF56_105189 [Novosphingobium sp. PhB165]|uniref:hypothetical protein n=1 Tax=Novosphingobium sp. PhB165 TaxID=2485105 RepID=UPI001050F67D|nr:hypothetical protein [Novosphingobium sp. PhB165]TCM17845.1 hypothetical protein EDF56_105189 [Novosphingobium sp. PhB165]
MPAFYLTWIAVLLAGFGARDQVTVAGLARRQGARPGVLMVALACAVLTAAIAAWAASALLLQLPPPARAIFAGIALALAGAELMLLVPRRDPKEPTNSLGALALVLFAQQLTDAARFLVFGLGVGLAAPYAAGAGGALGGAVLAGLAWACPQALDFKGLRTVRRALGGVLLLAAIVLFLREFSLL